MALEIVGAGLGRTGTRALKDALERLGLGPCYHMVEVFAHPEHDAVWLDAINGRAADWDALLANYRASVDWPACHFFRQLAAHYPRAKVILTLRDPEAWYASMSNTIFEVMRQIPHDADPARRIHNEMLRRIMEETFDSRYDEAHVVAAYERHNAEVRSVIAPERLFVFDVAQGWIPLCRFLNVPVPDSPFPRMNTTEEFRNRVVARRQAAPQGAAP